MSQGGYPLSFLYPWYNDFETTIQLLLALQTKVAPNVAPALKAMIVSGETIQSELDAGTTVSSDNAKQWLYGAQKLAAHLTPSQAQPIVAATTAGQATPDDSLVAPIAGAAQRATDWAHSIVDQIPQAARSAMPWIITLVAAAIVVPFALREIGR